jgi:hypothetical protein
MANRLMNSFLNTTSGKLVRLPRSKTLRFMTCGIARSVDGDGWRSDSGGNARRGTQKRRFAQALPEPFKVRLEGRFSELESVHDAFTGKNAAEGISGN